MYNDPLIIVNSKNMFSFRKDPDVFQCIAHHTEGVFKGNQNLIDKINKGFSRRWEYGWKKVDRNAKK